MNRIRVAFVSLTALAFVLSGLLFSGPTYSAISALKNSTDAAKPSSLRYGELPLVFEVNEGQASSAVKFLSR